MTIIGCRIDDEGTIIVEWYEETENNKPQGGIMYQSIITEAAKQDWQHVGYYANELMGDLEELVVWFEKYRKGLVT